MRKVIGGLVYDDGNGTDEFTPKSVENQASSSATTVAGIVKDFNALLVKLKTAGIMESDEESST